MESVLTFYPFLNIYRTAIIGNYLFEVVDSKNSSIGPGDTFNCFLLQKGRLMYMDNFRRRDKKEYVVSGARYAVGLDNGLTALEILE